VVGETPVTNNPAVDNPVNDVTNVLQQVDPEFDPRGTWYLRFGLAFDLFSVLIQKNYEPIAPVCSLDWSFRIVVTLAKATVPQSVNSCGGFAKANEVKALHGGLCAAKSVAHKHLDNPLISFDRSTELDANCLCYNRYKIGLFRGRRRTERTNWRRD
jgi:hypothetical protein